MAAKLASDLFHEISRNRIHKCDHIIGAFAESVYPENPDIAATEILSILWIFFYKDNFQTDLPIKIARKVLSKEKVQLMEHNFNFMFSENKLTDAGPYLSSLESDFPDPEEKQIAHAMILQDVVASLINSGNIDYAIHHSDKKR
jgi:hypothetical protein